MCKSVPQMDAVRTRTSTSAGPIDGTGAFSNERPRAGCILRKAFMVEDIKRGSSQPIAMVAHAHRTGAAPLRPSLARCQLLSLKQAGLLHPLHNPDLLQRLQI